MWDGAGGDRGMRRWLCRPERKRQGLCVSGLSGWRRGRRTHSRRRRELRLSAPGVDLQREHARHPCLRAMPVGWRLCLRHPADALPPGLQRRRLSWGPVSGGGLLAAPRQFLCRCEHAADLRFSGRVQQRRLLVRRLGAVLCVQWGRLRRQSVHRRDLCFAARGHVRERDDAPDLRRCGRLPRRGAVHLSVDRYAMRKWGLSGWTVRRQCVRGCHL